MEVERGPSARSAAPAPPPPRQWAWAPGLRHRRTGTVVPVFFGTDRGRRECKRVAYGTDAGTISSSEQAIIAHPGAERPRRPWAIKIPYTSVVLYQQDEEPGSRRSRRYPRSSSWCSSRSACAAQRFQDQALRLRPTATRQRLRRGALAPPYDNYDGAPTAPHFKALREIVKNRRRERQHHHPHMGNRCCCRRCANRGNPDRAP